MLVNHLMRCHFILGILLCIKTGVAHYKAVPCLSILTAECLVLEEYVGVSKKADLSLLSGYPKVL